MAITRRLENMEFNITPTSAHQYFPVNMVEITHEPNVGYHYFTTYDGLESKIYRDGQLISTQETQINTINSADRFTIGLTELGWNNYFKGAIDELSIYNNDLSASEIANLYVSTSEFNTKVFQIYPNPVSGTLNIKDIALGANITITDISGRVVYTSTASNELMSISTENWSNGLYLIQTELNGAVQQEKVVVQK